MSTQNQKTTPQSTRTEWRLISVTLVVVPVPENPSPIQTVPEQFSLLIPNTVCHLRPIKIHTEKAGRCCWHRLQTIPVVTFPTPTTPSAPIDWPQRTDTSKFPNQRTGGRGRDSWLWWIAEMTTHLDGRKLLGLIFRPNDAAIHLRGGWVVCQISTKTSVDCWPGQPDFWLSHARVPKFQLQLSFQLCECFLNWSKSGKLFDWLKSN